MDLKGKEWRIQTVIQVPTESSCYDYNSIITINNNGIVDKDDKTEIDGDDDEEDYN